MGQVILLFVVGAVAGLLIYAVTRPDHFRVERSAVIAAPPDTVFDLINNFRLWQRWSPWEGRDPAMRRLYDGPEAGVGAVYGWAGNNKVGEGRMEITESVPGRSVAIKLDFLKPFPANNRAIFLLTPEAGGTRVTWSMEGPQPFVAKLMGAVMNMDRMVGRDFEQGLANLDKAARAPASA